MTDVPVPDCVLLIFTIYLLFSAILLIGIFFRRSQKKEGNSSLEIKPREHFNTEDKIDLLVGCVALIGIIVFIAVTMWMFLNIDIIPNPIEKTA